MKSKRIKSKTFPQLVLFLICIFVLPVIILGWNNFAYIRSAEKDKYIASINNSAAAYSSSIDDELKKIMKLANYFTVEPWIKKMSVVTNAYSKEFTVQRRIELRNNISNYETNSILLSYIAIIFPQKDLVVSQWGWSTIDDFTRVILKQSDEASKEKLIQKISQYCYFSICEDTRLTIYRRTGSMIPIVHSLEMIKSPRAVAVFFIDPSKLDQFIEGSSSAYLQSVAVYSGEDAFFSHVYDKIEHEKDSFPVKIKSTASDWTYEFWYRTWSYTLLKSELETFALVILVLLMFGCLLSFLLARVTYKPFNALLAKIMNNRQIPYKRIDGYHLLGEQMDNLANENGFMHNTILEYRNVIRQQTIHILLTGFSTIDLEKYNDLNLDYRNTDCYCVMVLSRTENIIPIQDGRRQPGWSQVYDSELNVLGRQLVDLGIKYFQVVEQIRETTVLILCFRDLDIKEIAEKVKLAYSRISELLKNRFTVVEGPVETGIAGISSSYHKAMEKLNLRRNLANQSILFGDARYYYPTDWENQLINNLKYGKCEKVLYILNEIEKENINRKLSVDVAARLVSILIEDGERVLLEMKLEVEIPKLPVILNGTDEDNILIRSFASITSFFEEICSNVMLFKGDSRHMDFFMKILAYINENITDPDLTLKSLSNRYEISGSFISKLFREIHNVNFYDYISRRRIDTAKNLIRENNYSISISTLAAKTGYDNDYTFRRAFMRYEGITPSEYMKHREEGMSGNRQTDQQPKGKQAI